MSLICVDVYIKESVISRGLTPTFDERSAKVFALTRELHETRQVIAATAARQLAIMKMLDDLGALRPLTRINHEIPSESGQ
jgi:hypothetical protein